MERPSKTTVFSKPDCGQCTATYRALDAQGIDYDVIDLSEDLDAFQFVKDLGHQRAPVVVTATDHWSGFRPDKIAGITVPRQASHRSVEPQLEPPPAPSAAPETAVAVEMRTELQVLACARIDHLRTSGRIDAIQAADLTAAAGTGGDWAKELGEALEDCGLGAGESRYLSSVVDAATGKEPEPWSWEVCAETEQWAGPRSDRPAAFHPETALPSAAAQLQPTH